MEIVVERVDLICSYTENKAVFCTNLPMPTNCLFFAEFYNININRLLQFHYDYDQLFTLYLLLAIKQVAFTSLKQQIEIKLFCSADQQHKTLL